MEILIKSQPESHGVKSRRIKRKLERALRDLGCHDKELSILFTDDKTISELNQQYLGREGPTNVLAFPTSGGPQPRIETPLLGDVVISVETALRESRMGGDQLEQTIDRLLIHGILHLLGFDHEGSLAEAERMEAEENRLMTLMREE